MKYSILFFLPINLLLAKPIITNIPLEKCGTLQIGNAAVCYSMAKMLSLKYNIPFVYSHFPYHELFAFSYYEQSDLVNKIWNLKRPHIPVRNETDIINNLDKDVIFYTLLETLIDYIDPAWIDNIKQDLQLNEIPHAFCIPNDTISVALHIRKGNGGGQIYDGELASIQEFDFDRNRVVYLSSFENFALEFDFYERRNGHFFKNHFLGKSASNNDKFFLENRCYGAQNLFVPNQYYIDQIYKLSNDLQNYPLFIQLFTDDKNPYALLKKISNAVHKDNIQFHYEDNRYMPYKDRMAHDLYMMSRCDVMIRSQSTFARIAELLGNHFMVFFPVSSYWENNKLIVDQVAQKIHVFQ